MSMDGIPGLPGPMSRWIRKSQRDLERDLQLPIPTQIVSNEEYSPLPQTVRQAKVEALLLDIADRQSRRLGMDRRSFLRTSCGMAAAFTAMNTVFGRFFDVRAQELTDPAATVARPRFFILDAQTHHVPEGTPRVPANQAFLDYLIQVRHFGGNWNPSLRDRVISPTELQRINYIKEIFLDSETDVAVVSGLPQLTRDSYVVSPEEMVGTRSWVNELAILRWSAQGILIARAGETGTRRQRSPRSKSSPSIFVEGLSRPALDPNGEGWWLDDEKAAHPRSSFLAQARREEHLRAIKASRRSAPSAPSTVTPRIASSAPVSSSPRSTSLDLNFLVWSPPFPRSGRRHGCRAVGPALREVPWVSDLLRLEEPASGCAERFHGAGGDVRDDRDHASNPCRSHARGRCSSRSRGLSVPWGRTRCGAPPAAGTKRCAGSRFRSRAARALRA
ncbi:MAG: hypothetical protein R3E12_04025 [Candidatus Eisenbacteria bacterium]